MQSELEKLQRLVDSKNANIRYQDKQIGRLTKECNFLEVEKREAKEALKRIRTIARSPRGKEDFQEILDICNKYSETISSL